MSGIDDKTLVRMQPGDVLTARMADPADCRTLGVEMWTGLWVLAIRHQNGTESIYPADKYIAAGPLSGRAPDPATAPAESLTPA